MHKGNSVYLLLTCGLMAALTAVGGLVRIPAFPVAFTLQTFFVYLSGIMLPGLWAPLSQLLYIGLGLFGLPIFAAGGGPGYVLHPTFGFLLGFPLASAFVARYGKETFDAKRYGLLYGTSYLIISIVGITYLYFNLKWVTGKPIALSKAVFSGLILFLPSEAVKIWAASMLSVKLTRHKWMNK